MLVLAGSQAATVAAKSATYQFDPVHTRVIFQVGHAGFSNQPGSFSGIEGSLDFDEQDWSQARLSVRIPIGALQLGDANWNQRILDRTFFDVGKFPDAKFISTQVMQTNPGQGMVTGELTLHGITRPVTLAITLNALKRHPLTRRMTAGFSATTTLSRRDFGMDSWRTLVGDEVRLVIEVEATRSRDSPETSDPPEGRNDALAR